jgi:hypothetical protein
MGAVGEVGHGVLVTIGALEDRGVSLGPSHGAIARLPDMTIATAMYHGMEPGRAQIAIHVERLVGIVTLGATDVEVFDANEAIVLLPLDLREDAGPGREPLVAG